VPREFPSAAAIDQRVEVRPGAGDRRANALPTLCRLLRRLVEHDEHAARPAVPPPDDRPGK
jgi:hypothetical protein